MSANFIIHIGAAKTGSSAVQAFLRRNAATLAERGYLVPDRHLGLSTDITGEHVWAIQERIMSGDAAGLCARLEQAAQLAGAGKTIMLSAENLSNLGNHQFLKDFCKTNRARIVVYIRRQDELLTSAWQQWHCKTESDFQAWLLRALKTYGQWERLTANWESVAGPENIVVRLFERDAMIEHDLLKDFVFATGLADHAGDFDYDIGMVNPSFTDIVTSLVEGNRRLFHDGNDNTFFNFLLKISPSSFYTEKKVSLISRAVRESIYAFYSDVNNAVKKKYFPDRPNLFNPIDHSKYNYLEKDALQQKQMQLLMEFIFRTYQNLDARR